MEPRTYVPLFLERQYTLAHPELTSAARELAHDQIERDPEHFATDSHACALVSYMRAHDELTNGLFRMEDLPDSDFERDRGELFERISGKLAAISQADPHCVDARLVAIQLADISLDACLGKMIDLERETRERLVATRPGFDPELAGLWTQDAIDGAGIDAAELTMCDPEVIGWLHTVEALAQGCIFTARYRAAAAYARTVMRAEGYPNLAVGTLFLALARLEDEDGFFDVARDAGEEAEGLPWFLLGRTILLYKLGQHRSARRALRDFAARCDGGAFFLINPTYHDPYLPVRPAAREPWDLSHQAVWEADGIIADTPDFAAWAESVEGIRENADEFAMHNGF